MTESREMAPDISTLQLFQFEDLWMLTFWSMSAALIGGKSPEGLNCRWRGEICEDAATQ